MENNDKSNITIGLPKPNAAIFWAPAGTTLPTSATDELDSTAFSCLGYATADGVTVSTAEEGDDIEAWGPETVMHSQTAYRKTVTFNLLETARVAVLKFLYGNDNVTEESDGSVTIDDTGVILPRGVLVIDTLQNNGAATPRYKRQIFGDAQFIDRSGDHVYNNSDPLSFPVTLNAYKFTPAEGEDQTYVRTYLSAGGSISG